MYEFIENEVIDHVLASLKKKSSKLIRTGNSIFYNENIFEINFYRHLNIFSVVITKFSPNVKSKFLKKEKFKIDGGGRYSILKIKSVQEFISYIEIISTIITHSLKAGYYWLTEFVISELSKIQNRVASAFYSHLHKLFNNEIVNQIWLYVIVDDYGFYITNDNAITAAQQNINASHLQTTDSPQDLILQFATSILEYDKILTKIAIVENRSLLSEKFSKTPYSDTKVPLAESAIYASDSLIVFPLLREGSSKLSAGYNPSLNYIIEPVLKKERDAFKSIMEQNEKKLRNTLKELKQQNLIPRLSHETTIFEKFTKYIAFKPKFAGIEVDFKKIVSDLIQVHSNRRK